MRGRAHCVNCNAIYFLSAVSLICHQIYFQYIRGYVCKGMFSVNSVSIYRRDETGLIKLRISSDTQFIINNKIYQFYLCYKTTLSIATHYQWPLIYRMSKKKLTAFIFKLAA